MVRRHIGRALKAARRPTILPAAARLVEALHTQVEDLPAAAVRIAVAAVVVVVVEGADPMVAAVVEAAAAITRVRIAPELQGVDATRTGPESLRLLAMEFLQCACRLNGMVLPVLHG
jgi:hypothetical protein